LNARQIIFFVVTRYLYDATWRRINNNTLEFTCEVACRTPSITECNVVLSNLGSGRSNMFTGQLEDISSRFATITVVIDNVDPMRSYMYSAGAIAIANGELISTTLIRGEIPALTNTSKREMYIFI